MWCFVQFDLKRASRHNSLHFFDISTSKSGPRPTQFLTFFLESVWAKGSSNSGGLSIIYTYHLLIFTSSHLHIFTSHISSSHLLIFTSLLTSSHLHIFTSSHLHIFTSSHIIFTSSHLHIFTYHLLTFTSSHLHIFTSSHLPMPLTFSFSHVFFYLFSL